MSTEAAQAQLAQLPRTPSPTPHPNTNPHQAQLAQLPRTAASTRLLKQLADFNP